MPLGDEGLIGRIGDGPFGSVGVDLSVLLRLHGVGLSVVRHDPSLPRDSYGKWTDTPDPFTVVALVTDHETRTEQTEAGGRTVERLFLVAPPGAFALDDEIAYGGATYLVRGRHVTTVGGQDVLEEVIAEREVAT